MKLQNDESLLQIVFLPFYHKHHILYDSKIQHANIKKQKTVWLNKKY